MVFFVNVEMGFLAFLCFLDFLCFLCFMGFMDFCMFSSQLNLTKNTRHAQGNLRFYSHLFPKQGQHGLEPSHAPECISKICSIRDKSLVAHLKLEYFKTRPTNPVLNNKFDCYDVGPANDG